MKRKTIILFVILYMFTFSSTTFAEKTDAADIDSIKCSSYILIDEKSGQVLAQRNIDEKLYPASTTKIMTAILALEYGDLNRKFVASSHAVNDIGKDGMNIGIVAGEELTLEDLLNALLVRSANETANIIAENLAPDQKEFVKLMNKRAAELGCTNTNFVNPCGKDSDSLDKEHLTTASDLSKIARHAMSFPKFREIVKKKVTTIPETNKMLQKRYLGSTNKLLRPTYKSQYYTEITGIKTGFTNKAGQNLVSSAIDKDGNELIAVILGVHEDDIFSSSKDLFEYGFKNYVPKTIVTQNDKFKSITLPENNTKVIEVVFGGALSTVFPVDNSNLNWAITSKETINPTLKAPIKIGDSVGNIEYFINNSSVGTVPLISNTDLPLPAVNSTFAKIKSINIKAILVFILKFGITTMTILLLILLSLRYFLPFIKRRIKFKKSSHNRTSLHTPIQFSTRSKRSRNIIRQKRNR